MDQRAPHVLVVCTANVCRSAMAEGLLRDALEATGYGHVVVSSAGTGRFNMTVDPVACAVVGQRGVDISAHQPRQLTADVLAARPPDLIVTMTRQHLRAVVGLDRDLWPRTFTLLDLARRTAALPDDPASFAEWITKAGANRAAATMLHDDPDDDIVDPFGMGRDVTARAADQIEGAVRVLASLGCWAR